ncbi:heavy metal-associated isoprenylated plant protein 9 [Pyrus x bretschneideri]|uniref:heavy metal-associated isoprenylated plant protein 9 n=1 Tax=Pyrus x bretschneideri TaxID=225117 RepID=UPI00202FCD6D|nr:heavy metal-associated isoprenylated plant protein 9 [Pyrus x bretschneideri]
MGEEAKQEQAKAEEKAEVKVEENKDEKAEEEKKEKPKPPSPFVLFVDLHCVGCAKKIERSIMRIRGVEGVVTDMARNEVTIKGIVEPQAVCNKIMKKTKRIAKVLSPLPAAEGEAIPEVVASQVSGLVTVELEVNMHCEACAEQLKRKILKFRGVQSAVTDHSSGKVMVTGTMDGDKLVEYVYRRTKKQARIVPQPEPEPEKKEEPAAEEAKPEEKKEENAEKKEEEKPAEGEAKKEEGGAEGGESSNKEGEKGGEENKEEEKKVEEMMSGSYVNSGMDEERMKRTMQYYYQPLYVIERIPPPQLFSDENPNACCIS